MRGDFRESGWCGSEEARRPWVNDGDMRPASILVAVQNHPLTLRNPSHYPLAAVAEPANILSALPAYVREAVKFYWHTRAKQVAKQKGAGGTDQGCVQP